MVATILAALAATASAASAAVPMPQQWDPARVAANQDPANSFLLRPGEIVAGPGDGPAVAGVLSGWRQAEQRPFGLTLFTRTPQTSDPTREVLDAIAKVRKYTSGRPQGPAAVAPNYVFVGEAAGTSDAINFHGEPRIQGGPGSTVRLASMPPALPSRGSESLDGEGVRIAVLDTGMFDHIWLRGVQRAPNSADTWDVEQDGYGDNEAGHGTFIAGLILQVAPAASVYAVKVLDSHGVGDDFTVAKAMQQLPADIDVINLSLGGYTDRDAPPLAVATALASLADKRTAVVSAAGNQASKRPFWPAAFPQVLGVGAVDESSGKWRPASFSNYGPWVDAIARGSMIQSTFATAKTKVATGPVISRLDPTVQFDGWAEWDGTSFSTPIAAAMIARTMSRDHLAGATEGLTKLVTGAPASPFSEFPHAVLIDEYAGKQP